MTELRVPKLNNNDTEYVLVEWLVGDGKPRGDEQPESLRRGAPTSCRRCSGRLPAR